MKILFESKVLRKSRFKVGDKVVTTMGIKRKGTIVKPFNFKDSNDGSYHQKSSHVPVVWSDGTKGYHDHILLKHESIVEAVDPEERKLRLYKVAKRIPILKKAHDMALAKGSEADKFSLLHKLKKATAILNRDKKGFARQRFKQAGWSDIKKQYQAHAAEIAKVDPIARTRTTLKGADPEERSIRIHRLRSYAKIMGKVAHNTVKFDNNIIKAMGQSNIGSRASAIAKAYSGQDPKYTAFYKSQPRYVPKGKSQDKPLRARIMDVLAKKGAGIVHKNIDKEQRAKRIEKLVNLGTRSHLAYKANMRGDWDAARRLQLAGKRKTWARDPDKDAPKNATNLRDDALRAHTIAAKFLTKKAGKAKLQRVISRLKRGQSSVGFEKDWKALKNPIKDKLKVRTEASK